MNSTDIWCFSLQLGDQLEDLLLDRHVERRGRLVGDQQLRLAGDRHRDHHALLLAARHLVRDRSILTRSCGSGMPTSSSSSTTRARACAPRAHVQPQHLGDLVADGEHRVQRGHRLLEDHRDVLAADRASRSIGALSRSRPP
jgi:hypothetical protein